ncbi:sugar transferase [Anabaena sp. PCC 7108]|uniref:sugar transferase n=1 Tax=Anabaena sp. PCC 7108 TaxID=163908 RepID=UPI00035CA7A7|nr:sugar transferase [Anabaena sp. PCC 7108]
MLKKQRVINQLSQFPTDIRASTFTRVRKGDWWRRLITLVTVDTSLLLLAWLLIKLRTNFYTDRNYLFPSLLISISIQIGALAIQGNYAPGNKRHDYWNLIRTLTFAHSLILVAGFLDKSIEGFMPSNLIFFWLTSTAFICFGRLSVNKTLEYLRKRRILACNSVFIICSEEEKEQALSCIQTEQRYSIAGTENSISLDKDHRLETLEKLNKLGVTEVFISLSAIQNRIYLCWLFQTAGITVHLLPMELKPIYRDLVFHNVGGIACLSFISPAITGKDFWLKRIFDFCFACLFLIFTFPIYLAIAIAIKLDSPGSAFYRQTRIGLHGKEFKVWKFRTMRNDAEKMQKELEALNQTKDGILFKIKDDPRVTRIGRFLRRYSLDELPQLFNVVLGEMSLVGPRPLPTRDVNKFSARHLIRQEILPGVTGLWQVSGRSDILDFEQVLNLDLTYIENWSLWLDFQILLKTVSVVLNKEGAY